MVGISIARSSKDISLGIVIFGVLALIIGSVVFFINASLSDKISLYLGDGVFKTSLALNEASREKGLSGVSELPETEALLMAFPTNGKWQIWMKDMQIPIDIVWLDENKRVVYIVTDADPALDTTVTFTPQRQARYVVELPAGTVADKSIMVGHSAIFSLSGREVK